MILQLHQLQGIKSGKITYAFRRWEKPSVKKGGSMKTAMGAICFIDVEPIKETLSQKLMQRRLVMEVSICYWNISTKEQTAQFIKSK